MWLVLLHLKINPHASQRQLADAVGVREATLTHHLNAMENDGLLTRRRDPANRRVHIVEISERGSSLFLRLRDAAVSFDSRLRLGLSEPDLANLRRLLTPLAGHRGRFGAGASWSRPPAGPRCGGGRLGGGGRREGARGPAHGA